MYNLKTPAIQKLVSKLVTECDEYFKSKIDSKEEDYKKFIEDYNDVIKNTETFRPNTQTEVNVTETTLKKLRSEGWDNADDPVLMKYEKDNSGVFNLKGGKTKLYDSGISFKGRTFKGQTSKENASLGLYERLKRSNIVFSDTEENGVVFYKDAGKGFEQDFSNGITMTYEEWLAANNLGQGTTAGDEFTEDYQAYLRRDRKATFETVPVQYTEAKWIMFKDNDDNKDNNNKILVSDDKLWPNDFFPDKPKVNTYGELYKWLFNTEYGSIYYDEKSVEYWSNPNWAIGSEGRPLKNENEEKESLGTQADITAFGFVSPSVIGVLTGTEIALTVPNGTDVSSLIVNFSSSNGSTVKVGTTVQVSGTTANDFSSPVAYTVIAEDGVNLSTYNVKVTVVTNPQSTQADITAFSFASPSVTGIINGTDITLLVPIATDVSSLIATFTNSNNSVVKVGTTIQVSGTTPNDFNSPVAYTVLAGNGIDISTYNVKVTRSFLSNIPGTTGTNTTNTTTQTTNNLFNPKYYAKGPTASESTTQGEKFDLVTGLSYKCLRKSPIDYIPTKVSDNIKSNTFQNGVFSKLSTNRVSLMTYKKFDFGKKTITPDVFAKRAVDLYLEKFDNSLILNEWNAKIANDFWSNGLKNKIDGKSDIGIKHFIAREYPYNLGYYGDDSFFEIDNPWEDTTTLYDLLIEVIKEKNPELVKKPDVPLAPKFKPTIMVGETEVFVLDGVTKKDLSNFSIYVGDPKKWPVRENAEKEAEKGNIDDFEDVLDEEYLEEDFEGEGENLFRFEDNRDIQIELSVTANTNFSAAAIESGSEIGGYAEATSNGDGTVSNLLASSPVTTKEAAGKYADKMVPPGFNATPIYSQGSDPRWKDKKYDKNGTCGDNSTIASSGCGPTSMSMLVNHWAAKGKSKFTSPNDMASLFEKTGCRVCGSGSGISGKKIKEAFEKTFGLIIETGVGVEKVERYIKAGYPAVISGKGYNGNNVVGNPTNAHYNGGHFVCLTGVDSEQRIRVNDPGRAANTASEKHSTTGAITHFPAGKNLSSCVGVNQTIIVYPIGENIA